MKNSMYCDLRKMILDNYEKHYKFAVEYGSKMSDEQVLRLKNSINEEIARLQSKSYEEIVGKDSEISIILDRMNTLEKIKRD